MRGCVRILIVEDEALILMVAQEAVESVGFEVVTAEDGPAALVLLAEDPARFTGLITDYNLGSAVTGQDVIEAMRRVQPNAPIILASAFPDAVPNEWRWRHNVELLMKPYRPAQLAKMALKLLRPAERRPPPDPKLEWF
jgi:CheY-like chemotaxis protein